MLHSDGSLLAYQAFSTSDSQMHFSRLRLDWLPHMAGAAQPPAPAQGGAVQPSSRLVRFEQLGEETHSAGVFVCGQHPAWLIASRWVRQAVALHSSQSSRVLPPTQPHASTLG